MQWRAGKIRELGATRTTRRRSPRAASRANGRDTSPRHRSSRRDCSHDTGCRRPARRTERDRSARPGCNVGRRARRCGTSRSRPCRAGRPRADRPRSRTSALGTSSLRAATAPGRVLARGGLRVLLASGGLRLGHKARLRAFAALGDLRARLVLRGRTDRRRARGRVFSLVGARGLLVGRGLPQRRDRRLRARLLLLGRFLR